MVDPPPIDELEGLRQRVDALAALCRRLMDEQGHQRAEIDALRAERQSLISRHEQARTRVEALIGRLKLLEPGP